MTRILTILFLLAVIAIVVICGISYWAYSAVGKPHEHDKAKVYIKIEKGSTPPEIISKLASEGIIGSETAANHLSAGAWRRQQAAGR